MRVLGFLFKLVLVAIVVVLILQAEYKGRKLKTYVMEYIKSLTSTAEVAEEEVPPTDALKPIKKQEKVVSPVKKEVQEHKKVKQPKSDAVDIPEEDRAELQDLLEKEKGK